MRHLLIALLSTLIPTLAHAEAVPGEGISFPWQLNFMEPASPVMETLVGMHDWMLILITAITVFVLALMIYACIRFSEKNNPVPSKTSHNTMIEIIWTLVPIIILAFIVWPAYKAHKQMNDIPEADITLKVTGYQWYWNYEYPDEAIIFDSNIIPEDELKEGQPRLLAVDNAVVVPVNKNIRLLLTGGDVMHAWALPAFGVKQDTIPGRLNESWFRATKTGTYYGQCSELCGRLHGFMPIRVDVVSEAEYAVWLAEAKVKFASNDFGTLNYAAK